MMNKNKEKINKRKSLLKKAEKFSDDEKNEQEEQSSGAEQPVQEASAEQGDAKDPKKRHVRKARRERQTRTAAERIITKLIVFLVLLIVLVGGGYIYLKKVQMTPPETKTAMVERQLSYCQEFVSLKYRYSDVVSVKKSVGLSKSYSIVKYNGVIRVGIADLTECDYEVSFDGKSVKVKIPDTEILGNEISNQEVFDEAHSIFVPITLDEVFTEIQKSRETVQEELIDEGILDEAREYAKRIIKQMLLASGFEEVEIY